MKRFVATAGIDPETSSQGSVRLVVELDGEVVVDQEIVGRQEPFELDLDLSKRERLRILVDYGENLDLGDQLHLVEARFLR
jgi:hypothetical protein